MPNRMLFRPTKAIINLDAIKDNIKALINYLGNETSIIAVVKADGYGHGDVETAQAAIEAGAKMVSVATPEEAVRLREFGISEDILVMGPTPADFAEMAVDLNITVAVSGVEWLEKVCSMNYDHALKVHVKIDSGMGRYGVRDVESLQAIIDFAEMSSQVVVDGVFTHYSCADMDQCETTDEQYAKFMKFVELFPEKPRLVHASNSAATLLYPDYRLDAIRFGIGLYGIAPSEYVQQKLPFPLKRALSLETELAHVKRLEKGVSISYGATYQSLDDEWIGTLPIGYADGLRRGLRGQEVLVGGKRVPIVGTICMDQCMVKLPEEMPVGEKVVLLGKQGNEEINMEEWAERLDTIPYEIAVSFSKRIPRVYISNP
jgi:alanine racemase